MKKYVQMLLMASFAVLVLAACGDSEDNTADEDTEGVEDTEEAEDTDANDGDKLQVVASFTIISDMVREIGGDQVDVHNLVPTGTDPHEYEPLPEDIKSATDADILFYNGMNLEGGKDGWFMKMVDSVDQDEENVYSLTEDIEPMYLEDEDTKEEEVNPHSFIDPSVGISMAEDMRDAFIEVDPDNEDYYQENGDAYVERLTEIEEDYAERLGELPEENKVLVTSECAYQYMLDSYDMEEACIWKVDTEENGSPEQIKGLVEYVEENDVPILFVESNVDERPMETVSKESGVEIFEEPIYSDEIGESGEDVDTYVKYLNYNIDVITKGLGE